MFHKIIEEAELELKWPGLNHNKIDELSSKLNEWHLIICLRDQEWLGNLNQNDRQGQLIILLKSLSKFLQILN